MKPQPRYPVYIISKGRADCCLTANFLRNDGVDFRLVVEPQDFEAYAARYGTECIDVLPFSNLGLGGIPARNWVWEDSKKKGHERHWILDDNIRGVKRRYKAERFACDSSIAFRVIEDFVDRYENIAIAGMNYAMFAPDRQNHKVFALNCHVYSNLLILNSLPYRWRGRYNEDTDLCLQVLSGGWCTIQTYAFLVDKMPTMTMKGGNSAELYKGDGRLKMARSLERVWPYVVSVDRRFQRPQHKVRYEWKRFDTPLKKKPGLQIPTQPNDYGLSLKEIGDVKSPRLRAFLDNEKS